SKLPQVITSTIDLPEFLAIVGPHQTTAAEVQRPRPAGGGHGRPELSTGFVAPRDEIERRLAELWGEMFGLSEVGVHDNFFELGGPSLLAVQLTSRIRDEFRVELPVRDLLDSPTVADLAARVRGPSKPSVSDDDLKLAQVLDMVENLSDSDI